MIKKIVLFYMTGTGNSYKVAEWFAKVGAELGIATKMQQIRKSKLQLEADREIMHVFTFPTHGFTAPWLILKQIFCLPKGNGAAVLILPSRAGVRIKGVSLPGMEGTAGYLVAFILFLKGYKIKGVMGVDMPSNWTALHWGLSKENTEFITAAAQPKVTHFAKSVLAGKVYFDGIVPLALGLCLAPISFMYLIMAQLILSKLFFASDKCIGCGLCAKTCPKEAIRMIGTLKKRPYWTYSCDSCMSCMNICPYQAVEASPILAILFYYLTTVPIYSYPLRDVTAISYDWLLGNWAGIIQYFYIVIAVAFAYILLHATLGWRLFSMLLSRLSHTHYFRRYHAQDVNLKELSDK